MIKNEQLNLFLEILDGEGIGEALDAIFAWNAAGTSGKSKYDNLQDIVTFAFHESKNTKTNSNKKEKYHEYLISNYRLLDVSPSCIREYSDYYRVVLDNWDNLKNSTYTYRMLCAATKIQKWKKSTRKKNKLKKLIEAVASEWDVPGGALGE